MTTGRLTAKQCMGTKQGHLAPRWILVRGADASKATEKDSGFYQQQPGRVDGEVE